MLKTVLLTSYFLSVPTALLAPAVLMHGPDVDKPTPALSRFALRGGTSLARAQSDSRSAAHPVRFAPTRPPL